MKESKLANPTHIVTKSSILKRPDAISSSVLLSDELGKLVTQASRLYQTSTSWEAFLDTIKKPSNLSASVENIQHPASHLLTRLRRAGAPALMTTAPWSQRRLDATARQGSHKSADEYNAFVREEFASFIQKGFWTVLPYHEVRQVPGLRLSPLGVVPQRERRPRLIVDLSFNGVNDETVPLAPTKAMQFGQTLPCLLQRILDSDPRYGPIYVSKIDIADGFYRVQVHPRDVAHLGVMLPVSPGEAPLIAFPLVFPMGWVNSPPVFCAATETSADLINTAFRQNADDLAPAHRLEHVALASPTTSEPPSTGKVPISTSSHRPHYRRRLRYADVYVDDFITLCQGTESQRRQAMRVLLHTIALIFRPIAPTDGPHRQEPALVKKMLKGDAAWTTQKVVLGWLVDTLTGTIQLPPHRLQRLHDILASIPPTAKRSGVRKWMQVLGELRSMTLAVPGSQGLFSTLQHALKYNSQGKPCRVRLTQAVHQFLGDFRQLTTSLQQRPTRIAEVIPRNPSIMGTTDAAGHGMGSTAFLSTDTREVKPILWQARFPQSIQRELVSHSNPRGRVAISDLELAASLVQHDVLAQECHIAEHTVHSWHDNTLTQYWQQKGSASTNGPAAYLLRLQSWHQRHYHYVPKHDYLPGVLNNMADDCSRLTHLTDQQLLTHFSLHYPQKRPWRLCHPRRKMLSAVICGLARTPSEPGSFLEPNSDPNVSGSTGKSTATTFRSIPCSKTSLTPFRFSKSLPPDIDGALAPVASPSALAPFRTRYARWARRWPAWGPQTPGRMPMAPWTFASHANSVLTHARTPPPPHRVKPIPVQLVRHVATSAVHSNRAPDLAVADMIVLAFFFLLRPGEYTGSNNDDTPFQIADVQLSLGGRRLNLLTAPLADLFAATGVSLTFTTQKNGVRGEIVHHGRSGHPHLCPVLAAARRIAHLRAHQASPESILATYFNAGHRCTGSRPRTSPPCSRHPHTSLALASASFPPTLAHARSARVALWRSSTLPSTPIPFVSLAAGNPTPCSGIFIFRPSPLCVASPNACSPAGTLVFILTNWFPTLCPCIKPSHAPPYPLRRPSSRPMASPDPA